MVKLILDIGNTATKVAIYKNNELIEKYIVLKTTALIPKITDTIRRYKNICTGIASSTIGYTSELSLFLKQNFSQFVIFNQKTNLPFVNLYKTPETLGKDRLAAIAGAYFYYPEKNILIFDAGTALTIDFISGKNYLGGNISPGLQMRYKALHYFTKKLPELKPNFKENALIENTTNQAIIAGVQNSFIFEIETYVKKFIEKYKDIVVLITGGDGNFIYQKLSYNSILLPNLVTDGLAFILGEIN